MNSGVWYIHMLEFRPIFGGNGAVVVQDIFPCSGAFECGDSAAMSQWFSVDVCHCSESHSRGIKCTIHFGEMWLWEWVSVYTGKSHTWRGKRYGI